MNVKISFTVPFDEVPDRVHDAVSDTRQLLLKCAEDLNDIQPRKETIVGDMVRIEMLRKKLFKVDTQLSDSYNILVGYSRALVEQNLSNNKEAQDGSNEPLQG
jgi:hypothetical protein